MFQLIKDTKRYCSEPLTWLFQLLCYYHPQSRKICLSKSDVKGFYRCLSKSKEPDILQRTLQIIQEYIDLYKDLPTAGCIFEPIRRILGNLKSNEDWGELSWSEDCSAETVKQNIEGLLDILANLKVKMEPIQIAPEIPKRLKLYEPEIEDK